MRVLPETSGTREALQELFLQKGAQSIPELAGLMAQDSSLRNRARTVTAIIPSSWFTRIRT